MRRQQLAYVNLEHLKLALRLLAENDFDLDASVKIAREEVFHESH